MSAFSIFVLFFALSVAFCMCFKNVCLGSNVNPGYLCLFLWRVLCYLLLVLVWLSVLLGVG